MHTDRHDGDKCERHAQLIAFAADNRVIPRKLEALSVLEMVLTVDSARGISAVQCLSQANWAAFGQDSSVVSWHET